MTALASMADLFARHQVRVQTAPTLPPPPLPSPAPRPRQGAAQPIDRSARGDGYELRVAGVAAVRVLPAAGGWQVHNIGAGHKSIKPERAEADRLAWRIARLLAAP